MKPYEDLAPPLRPLEDSYELVRELGGTNATVVYLARIRSSGRLVALKTIRPQFLRDSEAVARFVREARTMSAFDHPNIMKTIAVEQIGQRTAAIVMEYLEGGTLREVLRAQGAMPFARVRAILSDLGEALRYAHGMGIVHRDVKPENIFIEAESGRAMLSDFGIARDMELDTRLTIAGASVGTPTYMSPEQIDGLAVDARSDIYSLGVLGWELVTGLRPWDGETLYGVIYKQKNDNLPAIRTLRADTPASLQEAIEHAMRKEHGARCASATAFLARLRDEDTDGATADHGTRDDLPTLQFRRANQTLVGVALGALAQKERATAPVERVIPLRPARESITLVAREPEVPEIVREPEVRVPRVTASRRRVMPPLEQHDPGPVEDSSPMESSPLSDERRSVTRTQSAELVAHEIPQRVPPPRRRNPLVIAIPSAIALAAALFLWARRSDQAQQAAAVDRSAVVVATTSGGSIAAAGTMDTALLSTRKPTPTRTPGARERTRSATVAVVPPRPVRRAMDRAQSPAPLETPANGTTPLLDRVADSDVELNRIYQQLIAALMDDNAGGDEPPAVSRLRVQQRTWLYQRDAACRVGSIDDRAACFREQSRSRATELRTRLETARATPASTRSRR